MKAVILAAGQGTRLKKYTQDLPKGMLKFLDKTIIQRQVELYRKCGIEDIIVVRGFAGDKIDYEGVKYYTNWDYANTNMVESLLAAKAEFDTDIILSYSDIVFSEGLLRTMIVTQGDFLVAVDRDWQEYWQARYGQIDFDTESLTIDAEGNITSIGLVNPPLEAIDARYIGLLRFSRRGLDGILDIMDRAHNLADNVPWQQSGKPVKKAYMTDLIQAIIDTGEKVQAVQFHHGWIEFDTNEDYEIACRWAKDGTLKRFIKLL